MNAPRQKVPLHEIIATLGEIREHLPSFRAAAKIHGLDGRIYRWRSMLTAGAAVIQFIDINAEDFRRKFAEIKDEREAWTAEEDGDE